MADYAYHRFPDHVPAIKALVETDRTFSAIMTDYEEMCTWLATVNRGRSSDKREIEHAQQLIRDLEEEILGHLKMHEGDTREEPRQ